MADNVSVTPGTGKDIATDEVDDPDLGTAIQMQVVKIADGALGGTDKWVIDTNGAGRIQGPTPLGSPAAGNPLRVGASARTALPASATVGNIVEQLLDDAGRLVASPILRAQRGQAYSNVSGTGETTIIGAVASEFHELTGLLIANLSVVATQVDFRRTTGGGILFQVWVPAFATQQIRWWPAHGIFQTAANLNWTAQCLTGGAQLGILSTFTRQTAA